MNNLEYVSFTRVKLLRAVLRGAIIFGCLYTARRQITSIMPSSSSLLQLIEKDLWRPSKCFIQMSLRMRYFTSSMNASLGIYLINQLISQLYSSDFASYSRNAIVGCISGMWIGFATISAQIPVVLLGGSIGVFYGVLFTFILRSRMPKEDNQSTESVETHVKSLERALEKLNR